MALATDVFAQFIWFFGNDQCVADPSLFQAVRDMAQGWQGKGLKAQYWGTSILKPVNELFWFLAWQSEAHAIAIKADPSYSTFVQDLEALATGPVNETNDEVINPVAKSAAETHKMVQGGMDDMSSLHMQGKLQGFIVNSWGITIEDARRGVYLCGWNSIEDHKLVGSLNEHKTLVEDTEEIFNNLTEISFTHVDFKSHRAQSSTCAPSCCLKETSLLDL